MSSSKTLAEKKAAKAADSPASDHSVRELGVAVIGSGFSGLGMAIRLAQQGRNDFLVFERAEEVGGTWRDNSYPGCQCDVMSHLYSFSFARNPDWERVFAHREEIFDYLRECADRFGVRQYIRFGHELHSACWEPEIRRWRLRTSQGEYLTKVLVTGSGYLNEPKIPQIPGLEDFEGEVFHSSRWNHEHELAGKRVAVIGTGASAIQFVPRIQPEVEHLAVFQRTPPWIGPKPDKPNSPLQSWMLHKVPGYQSFRRNFNMWGREVLAFVMARPKLAQKMQKMASDHLAESVPDPDLREKLTPDYVMFCKRLLFSNNYYPAIQQDNVELVTESIEQVTPKSVVTADGQEIPVDTIILGTGFEAIDQPIARRIRGSQDRTLKEAWSESGISAHRGTTIQGFPNLFMILGPNTTLGHSSQTVMIEAQINYVLAALDVMAERDLDSVEVLSEAQKGWSRYLEKKLNRSVWNNGGCQSWYLDENGRNPSVWPTYTWRFRKQTKNFDPGEYRLSHTVRRPDPAAVKH